MFSKALKAEISSPIELKNLPVGEYRGVASGYEVTVVIYGTQYKIHTENGIRSLRTECTVKINSEDVFVEYD